MKDSGKGWDIPRIQQGFCVNKSLSGLKGFKHFHRGFTRWGEQRNLNSLSETKVYSIWQKRLMFNVSHAYVTWVYASTPKPHAAHIFSPVFRFSLQPFLCQQGCWCPQSLMCLYIMGSQDLTNHFSPVQAPPTPQKDAPPTCVGSASPLWGWFFCMLVLSHLGSGSLYQALYLQECPPHLAQISHPILDSRRNTRPGDTAQALCFLTWLWESHLSWSPPARSLLSPGLPWLFFSLSPTIQWDPVTCPGRQTPTAVWGLEWLALS